MSRKRTRHLSRNPGDGGQVFQSVIDGPCVLQRLVDEAEPDRHQLLRLTADDAEFLGNQLVSLARIARTQACDEAYAAYVESSSDEPGWADRTLAP